MSEPADKSDDLIAELSKLMAMPPQGGGKAAPAVQPASAPTQPAPRPTAPMSGVPPIRIPGMDAPKSAAVATKPAGASVVPPSAAPSPTPVSASQAEAQRAPITGTIRIPGMDQPAPVSTSAPVGKFDFGGNRPATPIKPEPLASLTERLAAGQASIARETAPAPRAESSAVRVPSDLRPVSENRSFGEGPSLGVSRPAAHPAAVPVTGGPAAPASSFTFDFGFGNAAPAAAPTIPAAPPSADPIAALIEADMAEGAPEMEADEEPADAEPVHEPIRPSMATVTPINRGPASAARPAMAPVNAVGQRRNAANSPIPLKPVSVAPRPPESDRFAISPGVGLNVKPPASQPLKPQPRAAAPAPQPRDDSDPMSEIESLIGEAVRVELSPGPVRVQTPQMISPKVQLEPEAEVEAEIHHRAESAPVVPPLTTQFAPRRANIKDDSANTAEAAILAAAAAGAHVDRVEPSVGDESPYRRLKVKPQRDRQRSGVRQYIGMAVAGTLLLAAGLGLYWVLNMGRISGPTGAGAPQLTADATPVKVKPTPAAKASTDTAKSPVLAKMDGASSAPSSELLVSTDQSAAANVTRDVTPPPDPNGDPGLANRKVRTVTVRPDGTIVSGDDALAGGAELPVERPNVPAVPSAGQPTDLLANNGSTQVATAEPAASSMAPLALTDPTPGPAAAAALTSPTAADAASKAGDVQPIIDPAAVAPKPLTFPVKPGKAQTAKAPPALVADTPSNSSVNAVITGAQTPNGQIDLLGGNNTTSAAPAQPATPKPAQAAPVTTAAAYVQLASQPTQADAQASAKVLTAKYGALFNGTKTVIQPADLGQKGVRYRVRLPASSLSQANSICAQIKAQGGDCFATNG